MIFSLSTKTTSENMTCRSSCCLLAAAFSTNTNRESTVCDTFILQDSHNSTHTQTSKYHGPSLFMLGWRRGMVVVSCCGGDRETVARFTPWSRFRTLPLVHSKRLRVCRRTWTFQRFTRRRPRAHHVVTNKSSCLHFIHEHLQTHVTHTRSHPHRHSHFFSHVSVRSASVSVHSLCLSASTINRNESECMNM